MRVIAHVDLDSFYTAVEVARNPELRGKPVVVIQYNPFGDLSTLRPDDNRIKPDSNGSIIAASYEARAHGVKRNMMAQQAKALCPDLQIVQVPVAHGKADLTIYREAGAAVIAILSDSGVCERASIDEAYLDVTTAAQQLLATAARAPAAAAAPGAAASSVFAAGGPAGSGSADPSLQQQQQQQPAMAEAAAAGAASSGSTLGLPLPASFEGWHVTGVDPSGPETVQAWWSRPAHIWTQSDKMLAAGALVVAHARGAVHATLGFTCSAGLAHSKILAKLGSGLNKPAQQTVVPAAAVPGLLAPLPVPRLRQLGGKFGEEVMAALNIATVGELAAVPLPRLEAALGVQAATWLHRLAQGLDGQEVKPRTLPQSISCGKSFRGVHALTGLTAVHTWLLQLAQELEERVQADRAQHQRLPRLLTVSLDTVAPGAAGARQPGTAAGSAAAAAAVDAAVGLLAATAAAAGASAAAESALLGEVFDEDDDGAASDSSAGPAAAPPPQAPAAAAAAAVAVTAAAGAVGQGAARTAPRTWRAGVTSVSRSCGLRHVRADAIAADALGLVKKWARDRPGGFCIVGMFLATSNFSLAPTGASTLDRFFVTASSNTSKSSSAAAAATGDADSSGAAAQQQQQQQLVLPAEVGSIQGIEPSRSAEALPAAASHLDKGAKRAATAAAAGQRSVKQPRKDGRQQGSLASFLSGTHGQDTAGSHAIDAAAAAAAAAAASGTGGMDAAAPEPRLAAAAAAGSSIGGQLQAVAGESGSAQHLAGPGYTGAADPPRPTGSSSRQAGRPGAAMGAHAAGGARPAVPALRAPLLLLGSGAAAAAAPLPAGSAAAEQPAAAAAAAAAAALSEGPAARLEDPALPVPHSQVVDNSPWQARAAADAPQHASAAHAAGAVASLHAWLPGSQQQLRGQQVQGQGLVQQHQHQNQQHQQQQHQHQHQQQHQQPQQLSLEEVDPEVLAALPLHIQAEVRQQLRAGRVATTAAPPAAGPGRGPNHPQGRARSGSSGRRSGGRRPQQQREASSGGIASYFLKK